jgi:hypothetical protein
MKKEIIKKILREESNNLDNYPEKTLPNVDKEILYDYLVQSDGKYDDDFTRSFCKYLGYKPNNLSLNFFKELINLNVGLLDSSFVNKSLFVEVPQLKNYEVLFDVVEVQYVSSRWKVNTFGWNEEDVEERNGDDYDWWNGEEMGGDVFDSETTSTELISISPIDSE